MISVVWSRTGQERRLIRASLPPRKPKPTSCTTQSAVSRSGDRRPFHCVWSAAHCSMLRSSKLSGCDLVVFRVDDVTPNGYAVDRATIRQGETDRHASWKRKPKLCD